ncbi:unnamed protein product [Symbiodinium sp. CCMP2592]|nr:unnamed protein product [Symbiodinium sp. CCMP2592]
MYSVSQTRKFSKTPQHQDIVRPLTVLREGLVSLPPARVAPGHGRDHERALLVGSGLSFRITEWNDMAMKTDFSRILPSTMCQL